MAVSALVLHGARSLAGTRISSQLERLGDGLTKHSASVLSILLFIIGAQLILTGASIATDSLWQH